MAGDEVHPEGTGKPKLVVDKKILNERWSWWYGDFAKGPDTILPTVWYPVIFWLASLDATCSPHNGISSGVDGQSCTSDLSFNYSQFMALNGSNCQSPLPFGGVEILHDPKMPGCSDALAAYRALTPYTCNCTSVYSYVLGLRIGNLQSFQHTMNIAICAIVSPLFSAYVDYDVPKKLVITTWIAFMISMTGMMALGKNYIWVIAFVFGTIGHITYDILWPPMCAVLEAVTDTDEERGRMGGLKQTMAFLSQTIFVILIFGVSYVIKDRQMYGIVCTIMAILWVLVMFPPAIYYLQWREPAKKAGDKNLFVVIVSRFWESLMSMKTKHPEGAKYLIARAMGGNGIVTILGISTGYFTLQMKLSTNSILIISAIVLLTGAASGVLFSWIMKKGFISFKRMFQAILGGWIVVGIATPFLVYKEGDILMAIIIGGLFYGIGLAFFWSIAFQAFLNFVPSSKVGAFTGVYTFFTYSTGWMGSFLFSVIVQATANQRLAIATLPIWNILAFIAISLCDFEKGRKEAIEGEAEELSKGSTRKIRVVK